MINNQLVSELKKKESGPGEEEYIKIIMTLLKTLNDIIEVAPNHESDNQGAQMICLDNSTDQILDTKRSFGVDRAVLLDIDTQTDLLSVYDKQTSTLTLPKKRLQAQKCFKLTVWPDRSKQVLETSFNLVDIQIEPRKLKELTQTNWLCCHAILPIRQ